MRGPLVRAIFVIATTLAGFAVNASAATAVTLNFTTTTNGGTFTLDNGGAGFTGGNNYLLSGVLNVLFSTLTVGNDPTIGDNGTYGISSTGCASGFAGTGTAGSSSGGVLELNGNVLTLYGALTNLTGGATLTGLGSGCNTLATLTGPFTGTYTNATTGSFGFAGLTSMIDSGQLLSDLGLSGYGPTSLATGAGILTSNGSVSGNTDTYTASSEQFKMNLNTVPEPVSFLLGGSGLAMVLMLARRKRSQALPEA
jgi:hypothetical protein